MSLDYRQLMQENLDRDLERDETEALLQHLAEDETAAEENAKLETLHRSLERAPHMRAPNRLAATIMARLAETVEAQANMQGLPAEMRLALMLSTSMITMMMMPAMLMASYMVVNLAHDPKLLQRAMMRVIALQVMMIDGLVVMLEEVEQHIRKDPDAARIAMALIPIALKGMIEYMQANVEAIELDEA